jgi:RimJ/RimL family protein N-acetyltransferase
VDRSTPPPFLDTPLLQAAYRFGVEETYGRRSHDDADIDHAIAVARLVSRDGQPEDVVAAALLHDVLEDTEIDHTELRARFGDEITDLVGALTENKAIAGYARRKAALRGQVVEAGRDTATIFAADKLARLRSFETQDDPPPQPKLAHYRRTLELLCERYPDLPFLDEFRERLDALERRVDPDQQVVEARDGSRILLRRITPADADSLAQVYERLSPKSRERRFTSAPAHLSTEDLQYLTDVDGRRHDALVALDVETGELVGEARYVRERDRPDIGEVAVLVADEWQRRGIATALLTELTKRARRQGLRRYRALVATDNHVVLEALASRGSEATGTEAGQAMLEFEFPAEGLSERLPEPLKAALNWSARGRLRLLGMIARGVGQLTMTGA